MTNSISYYFKSSLILLASLLLISAATQAKTSKVRYYRHAQKLFRVGDYNEAAVAYHKYVSVVKKSLNENTVNQQFNMSGKRKVFFQNAVYYLAESYRLTSDFTDAETYYAEAAGFHSPAFPDLGYWYGITLRTNKKYDAAIKVFTDFINSSIANELKIILAKKELEDIGFIKAQLAKEEKNNLVVVPHTIEGQVSSYALSLMHGDTVAFTSVHTDTKLDKDGKISHSYSTQIYQSIMGENVLDNKKVLLSSELGKENGMATFTKDGKKMFFTKWAMVDGKKKSAIYTRTRLQNGWSNDSKMDETVNVNGYNSTEPYISEDGKYLFFSSDRPGGAGGFDIWYVVLDSSNHVFPAVNMGNKINTAGDEGSPYFHSKDRTLVFASNGLVGMGGFDIFYAKCEGNLSNFDYPVNPGAPINSVKDDKYYYNTDEDDLWNKGWLSSDRNSEAGLALFTVNPNNVQRVYGKVVDAVTKKPVESVLIVVKDEGNSKRVLTGKTTDKDGRYDFEVRNVTKYSIHMEKDGFADIDKIYTVDAESNKGIIQNETVYLEKAKTNNPTSIVKAGSRWVGVTSTIGTFGFKKTTLDRKAIKNLDSLASIMKNNPYLKVQLNGFTDRIGSAQYNLKLSRLRVKACVQYLIKVGVNKNRLVSKAYGHMAPVASERLNGRDNPNGRAKNRRVEYVVIADDSE